MSRSATITTLLFRSEPIMGVVLTSTVIGIGVWVTPAAIEALTPPEPPLGEVTVEGATPDAHQAVVEGIRRVLEGSYAYVCSRNADDDGPAAITLWQSDEHDRGALGPGEVLLLTHSSLLGTLSASYIDGAAESDDRVSVSDLTAPDAMRRFRSYGAVSTSVIATGVSVLTVEPAEAGPGRVELSLGLTWADAPDDAESAGPSRTVLRVRLRRVEGVGR